MMAARMLRNRKPTPEQLAEAARPMTRLDERREELRARFTEMQWDLGGAAYEMASRDYFRLDVLAGMAARLQIVDAELAEIERMSRLENAGAEGSCAGCGSLHARGALYCWRCGRNLFEAPARPALVAPPEPSHREDEIAAKPAPTPEREAPEPVQVEIAAAETTPVEPETPESFQVAPEVVETVSAGVVEETEASVPERPFARPWAGASSSGQATVGESVAVPPFAGATEIPTFKRPARRSEGSEADNGGI